MYAYVCMLRCYTSTNIYALICRWREIFLKYKYQSKRCHCAADRRGMSIGMYMYILPCYCEIRQKLESTYICIHVYSHAIYLKVHQTVCAALYMPTYVCLYRSKYFGCMCVCLFWVQELSFMRRRVRAAFKALEKFFCISEFISSTTRCLTALPLLWPPAACPYIYIYEHTLETEKLKNWIARWWSVKGEWLSFVAEVGNGVQFVIGLANVKYDENRAFVLFSSSGNYSTNFSGSTVTTTTTTATKYRQQRYKYTRGGVTVVNE